MMNWLRGTLSLAVFLASLPLAWSATPLPPLPDRRVASTVPSVDAERVATKLAEYTSPNGVRFHLCAVAFSDPQDRKGGDFADSAIPYVDELWGAWSRESARLEGDVSPHGIDSAKSVLIVIAIENRGVAIHPGSDWVGLGFENDEIRRTIDGSSFGRFARSGDYEQALLALVEAVDEALTMSLREIHERIGEAQKAVDGLRAALAHTDSDDEMRARLDTLVAQLAEARSAYDLRDYERATSLAENTAFAAEGLRLQLEKAEQEAFRQTAVAVGILVLLALMGLALLRKRMLRAATERANAADKLADFNAKISQASAHLLQLESEHALFFGGNPLRFAVGSSRDRVHALAAKVDQLFLRLANLEELRGKLARALAQDGPLSCRQARHVLAALHGEIFVDHRTRPKRQLFLSDHESVSLRLDTLFDDMQATYEEVEAELAELEELIQRGLDAEARLLESVRHIDESIARLGALELDPVATREAVARLRVAVAELELEDGQGIDRLASVDDLVSLADRAEKLLQTAQRLVAAAASCDEQRLELQRLDEAVANLRAQGFALADRQHALPRELGSLRKQLARVRSLVEAGEASKLEQLAGSLAEGCEQCASWVELLPRTPSLLESALPQARERLASSPERLPGLRKTLAALVSDYCPATLFPLVDNADEVEALQERLRTALDEATQAFAEKRYFDAHAHFVVLRQGLDDIDELHRAVETAPAELATRSAALGERLTASQSRLDDLLPPVDVPYAAPLREVLAAVRDRIDDLRKRLAQRPCELLDLETHGRELEETVDDVVAWAGAAHEGAERLAAEYPALRRRRRELGELLEGSSYDSEASNTLYRRARKQLEGLRKSARSTLDWAKVPALLDRANALLTEAELAARGEIDAGTRAAKHIETLEHAISDRVLNPDYELEAARKALKTAQTALESQQFELASAAAIEGNGKLPPKRQWKSSAQSSSSSSSWSGSSSSSSSSFWSSGSSFRSSSSGSSFRSSSDGSSFRSSSGGSSFRSSSGGSSFRSSSGGSSFRSSSGGSRW